MAEAYYKLKAVEVKGATLAYNADFYGSDGTLHWAEVWYEFTAESAWTPEAASALGAATDDEGRIAAVRLDCDRLLRELEDPSSPAGQPAARVVKVLID